MDITPIGLSFNAVDRGPERLSFNVFGGRVGFTIFSGNGSNRLNSQSLGLDAITMLKRDLVAVRDGQPGTVRTMVFQKWDMDAKKYNTTGNLIIGKDDKNVYYLEIQFNHNGDHKSLRFNMRAVSSVTSSTDEPDERIKSAIRMDALIMWLEDCVPTMMVLTNRPFTRGGGNNQSSNNNTSGAGGDVKKEYSGADATF